MQNSDGARPPASSSPSAVPPTTPAAKSSDPAPQPPQQSTPSTPPRSAAGLPTPPTSHSEFRPPPNPVASTSRLNHDDQLPDASPTTTISEHMGSRRAAARLSGGSASFERGDDSMSSQPRLSRRSSIDRNDDRSVALDRPNSTASYRSRPPRSPSHSPQRSPTPSPILGPAFADRRSSFKLGEDHDDADHDPFKSGHLSFPMLGVGVGPTKEEIELLVYGNPSTNTSSGDSASVNEDDDSVHHMLESLSAMGIDTSSDTSVSERERELAGMVKLLASRCNTLAESRDRYQAQLKSTRLTALSVISSIKTAHAHALTSEQGVRDRLEAELEGWKAQAKMLSALLNRAEARSSDDRKISAAVPTTFTERARNAMQGTATNGHRITSFRSDDSLQRHRDSHATESVRHPPSSPLPAASVGTEPVTSGGEEGRGRDRQQQNLTFAADGHLTTGLGISSSGLAEMETDVSPLSSLMRERNKLLTDKKHLKARVRDTEAQVYRLENELKSLRPYLVSGGIKGSDTQSANPSDIHSLSQATEATSAPGTAPTTPSRSASRKDKNRKKRIVTMGDAETEHLMLAARRLREMRKEQALATAATTPSSSADIASTSASMPGNAAGVAPTNSTHPPAAELRETALTASPIKRQASEEPMAADTDHERNGHPRTPPPRSAERPPKTPKSIASVPATPRTGIRIRDGDDTMRGDDRRDSWAGRHRRVDSASSFTGIDELLQAAETLNPGAAAPSPTLRSSGRMPPYSQPNGTVAHAENGYYPREPVSRGYGYPPLVVATQRGHDYEPYPAPPYPAQSSPLRMAHESPKRRRVSSAAFDFEPYGSPFLGDRQARLRTQTEGADPFSQTRLPYPNDYAPSGASSVGGASQGLSALDLLADQATASQNPSQGSDRSGGYEGVSPIGSLSSDDEMAADSASRRKAGSRFVSSRSGQSPARSQKGASSQSASRSGESKNFGGNQNPEKRLPYVRWTAEEDTKLRSAIKEHGQRWELISRAVGTRSYHQCRQRYLLMRRKEAAAKAQNEGDEGSHNLSASASDQHSQDSDYAGQGPSSTSRRKSSSHGRRLSKGHPDAYTDERGSEGEYARGVTSTPLHKLSIGAPAPPGSVYGQFSPTNRQGPIPAPSSQTPTHARSLSHPHGPSSPSQVLSSPYSSHTPSAASRRSHYPPPSPLSTSSRHLPPLQHPSSSPATGYPSQPLPPMSPHSGGGHHRQFSGEGAASSHRHHYQQQQRGEGGQGQRPPSPTTPTSSGARRMGAALYS